MIFANISRIWTFLDDAATHNIITMRALPTSNPAKSPHKISQVIMPERSHWYAIFFQISSVRLPPNTAENRSQKRERDVGVPHLHRPSGLRCRGLYECGSCWHLGNDSSVSATNTSKVQAPPPLVPYRCIMHAE